MLRIVAARRESKSAAGARRFRAMRVAILDDYQHVALSLADWKSLGPEVTLQAFHERLSGEDTLATRLADFEAIVAMRERTHFPRSLLERLPKLKLLVTTGMRNVAIDTKSAAEFAFSASSSVEPA